MTATASDKKLAKLKKQAGEVLKEAEAKGLTTNYFFATTFERYQTQLSIMEDLKKHFQEDGAMVTKEYVKGRANLYVNPAITEYNKTASAANNTCATLIKIVEGFSDSGTQEEDAMAKFLKG